LLRLWASNVQKDSRQIFGQTPFQSHTGSPGGGYGSGNGQRSATTSFTMIEKLANEFRQFGANIIVMPRSDTIDVGLPGLSLGSVTEQRYIDEGGLYMVKEIHNWSANVLGYAPFLYQVVDASSGENSQQVVLTGSYFDHPVKEIINADGSTWSTGLKKIASYWDVKGDWVQNDNDTTGAMIGTTVAEKLTLSSGSSLHLNYTDPETKEVRTVDLVVRGMVTTGGSEDNQIFVNLGVAQRSLRDLTRSTWSR
jgi:putative ABC transport system permease protein